MQIANISITQWREWPQRAFSCRWKRRGLWFRDTAAVVTFLLTVSFLFSTPGAAQLKYGFPVLGDAGQFLIKDLVLLGASFWTAAEAHGAVTLSE